MIVLVSGATAEVRKHPHVGVLVVPRAGNAPASLALDRPYAFDNDCFANWDEGRFIRMLDRFQHWRDYERTCPDRCLFVAAPDKVADAIETRRRFDVWQPRLRACRWPVAFVGQDGLSLADVPWDGCQAIFIGGSTEWKLGTVARDLVGYAKARGKWVHMGRVNSAARMKYAMRIGVDSIDGRQWSAWSRLYLPKIQRIEDSWLGGPLLKST